MNIDWDTDEFSGWTWTLLGLDEFIAACSPARHH